jgi:galactose mutarotase-like enzyme
MLRIQDRVENLSATPRPFGLMHHVNFGFPLVRDGARLTLDGDEIATLAMEQAGPRLRCLPAGAGWSRCAVAAPFEGGSLTATLGFDGAREPYLQLWQNLDPGTRVLAFEPCTSERLADGTSGPEPILGPGESWSTAVELSFAQQ